MNYAEYQDHKRKAELEGKEGCECSACRRYEHVFADQLEAERLSD